MNSIIGRVFEMITIVLIIFKDNFDRLTSKKSFVVEECLPWSRTINMDVSRTNISKFTNDTSNNHYLFHDLFRINPIIHHRSIRIIDIRSEIECHIHYQLMQTV